MFKVKYTRVRGHTNERRPKLFGSRSTSLMWLSKNPFGNLNKISHKYLLQNILVIIHMIQNKYKNRSILRNLDRKIRKLDLLASILVFFIFLLSIFFQNEIDLLIFLQKN